MQTIQMANNMASCICKLFAPLSDYNQHKTRDLGLSAHLKQIFSCAHWTFSVLNCRVEAIINVYHCEATMAVREGCMMHDPYQIAKLYLKLASIPSFSGCCQWLIVSNSKMRQLVKSVRYDKPRKAQTGSSWKFSIFWSFYIAVTLTLIFLFPLNLESHLRIEANSVVKTITVKKSKVL